SSDLRIYFPVQLAPNSDGTTLADREKYLDRNNVERMGTRFYYGGNHKVGDLKLDLKLRVETFGSLRLECGNTLRRAVWAIGSGGYTGPTTRDVKAHYVQKEVPALAPGLHSLTLAYVDGTVIAALDGTEIERQAIDLEPQSESTNSSAETIARVVLAGIKGRVEGL